jgi:poly-gamma-glutamate capsule biosynthesis protein CapA/YwtB (metallophosphatase superfamily)
LFAPIRSIVSRAALAICHVETPLAAGSPSGYPTFRTPVELAAAIRWTGWDACDTASNHTMDQGQEGVVSTLDALDRAGVKHTGSYRSAAEAARILILRVQGVRIAFLAYAYGSGARIAEPWSLNVISLSKIEADARRARRLGARLVVVNLHWGQEFVHTPTDQQMSLADTLLRHHIVDLIVGQHVHVVQPIRQIADGYVVFGEGNLISAQTIAPDREGGLIALIHVRAVGRRAGITGVDYIPTWVDQARWTVAPVGDALSALTRRGLGSSALAEELRTSYRITVEAAGRGPHIHPIPRRLR